MNIIKEMQDFSSHITDTYGESVLWNNYEPVNIRHRAFWNTWKRAKANAVPGWISVQDGMPEQGQKVLVFRPHAHEAPQKDPNHKICTYAGEGIFINSHFEHEITHWKPLDNPSSGESKND